MAGVLIIHGNLPTLSFSCLLHRNHRRQWRRTDVRALVQSSCHGSQHAVPRTWEEVAEDAENADGHLRIEHFDAAEPSHDQVRKRRQEGRTNVPDLALFDGGQAVRERQESASTTANEATEQRSCQCNREVCRVRQQILGCDGLGCQLESANNLRRLEDTEGDGEDLLRDLDLHEVTEEIRQGTQVVNDVPRDDHHPKEGLLHQRHRCPRYDQWCQKPSAEGRDASCCHGLRPIEAGHLLSIVLGNLQEVSERCELPSPGFAVCEGQEWLQAGATSCQIRHQGR
mmetsp:Transcript_48698/g.138214  ORF Transcript_48698/g.138214 Transcript_48698/m.138214 type:complete len:284 (+) Transcript_48698:329-1180(+)